MPTSTKSKTKPKSAEPYKTWVNPQQIITKEDTQTRMQGTNPELVDRYKVSMESGQWDWQNNPVELYLDKNGSDNPDDWCFYPGDGHHRCEAAQAINETVYALIFEGTARDARYHSTAANKQHGLMLSKADLRYHAIILLRDAEWQKMSDRAIGDHVGLSHPTIAKIRSDLEASNQIESTPERTGADGRIRKLPTEFNVGDWVEAPLVENPNQKGQGYIRKIGTKYLVALNEGVEYKFLATDAQRLWSPPEDIADYVNLLGLDRSTQVDALLVGWVEPVTGQADPIDSEYQGWKISCSTSNGGKAWEVRIAHPDYGAWVNADIRANNASPIDEALLEAQEAIDKVEALLEKLPAHPIRDNQLSKKQPENLPVENTEGSKPEAMQRPAGEIQKQIKEVDNSELGKKPTKERPDTPDELMTRLRLVIGQAELGDIIKLIIEKFDATAIGATIAKSDDEEFLHQFGEGIIDEISLLDMFPWEDLAETITHDEAEPPFKWSWASHICNIYRHVGKDGFVKILKGNDLYKDAIAMLTTNPPKKGRKTA